MCVCSCRKCSRNNYCWRRWWWYWWGFWFPATFSFSAFYLNSGFLNPFVYCFMLLCSGCVLIYVISVTTSNFCQWQRAEGRWFYCGFERCIDKSQLISWPVWMSATT